MEGVGDDVAAAREVEGVLSAKCIGFCGGGGWFAGRVGVFANDIVACCR